MILVLFRFSWKFPKAFSKNVSFVDVIKTIVMTAIRVEKYHDILENIKILKIS
jgi:hypothetical protein